MLSRIGRVGRWWLASLVVCAAGVVVVAVGILGRPHAAPDPVAGPAAEGTSRATPSAAGTSVPAPGASVSPSPVQVGLISTTPPPAPAAAPSPRPAQSPKPSPSPAAPSPSPYLTVDPASGAATLTPTWSSSACPSGFQGSAQLNEYTLSGTLVSSISNVIATVTSPFSGQLLGNVGALLRVGGISASSPGTLEWVVGCYSGIGSTGAQKLGQSIDVSLSADGSYTTSTPPG